MNLGNKLTVFQVTVCETAVTKSTLFKKMHEGSLFYLSFLIMQVGSIKQRIIFLKVLGH